MKELCGISMKEMTKDEMLSLYGGDENNYINKPDEGTDAVAISVLTYISLTLISGLIGISDGAWIGYSEGWERSEKISCRAKP